MGLGPPKEMKIADHLRLSPPPVTAAEVSATFPFSHPACPGMPWELWTCVGDLGEE